MDAKLISPFVEGIAQVLPQFGIDGVSRGKLALKEKLTATMDVTVLVGLSEDISGNVAYSMNVQTARNIASAMMGGMSLEDFNDFAQSAISELANMAAANAGIQLEGLGRLVKISPPIMIVGQNVIVRMSRVKTLAVELVTAAGVIEVNVGLEI